MIYTLMNKTEITDSDAMIENIFWLAPAFGQLRTIQVRSDTKCHDQRCEVKGYGTQLTV